MIGVEVEGLEEKAGAYCTYKLVLSAALPPRLPNHFFKRGWMRMLTTEDVLFPSRYVHAACFEEELSGQGGVGTEEAIVAVGGNWAHAHRNMLKRAQI